MKNLIISLAVIFCATFATQAQTSDLAVNMNAEKHLNEPTNEELTHTAAYPGGLQALAGFLQANLNYPMEARENAIEGKVKVVFEVTPSGKIQSASILSGIGYGCDEEALRVVNAMQNWLPARQNGYPIKTKVVVPITFELTR